MTILYDPSLNVKPTCPASFGRGLWHAEPWDPSTFAMLARREDDAAFLAEAEARRDARLEASMARKPLPARAVPSDADRAWAAANLVAVPTAAPICGGSPEPMYRLGPDGEWIEVEPIGPVDQDQLDRDLFAMFFPVAPVITPGPTAPIPPISGGAPCEAWERLAADAEEDAEWDRRAAESLAVENLTLGLIPNDLADFISRTTLVGHPA